MNHIRSRSYIDESYIDGNDRMYLDRKKKIPVISNRVKCIAGSALLSAGLIIMYISRRSRAFAHWYSTRIYPVWVNMTGRFMSVFPFSVSEILLYVVLLTVFLTFFRHIIRAIRKCAVKREFFIWSCNLYLFAGMLFFVYVINCGINYHRESFSESSGIRIEKYSAKELESVCLWLTKEVNSRSSKTSRDARGVMKLGGRKESVTKEPARTSSVKMLNKEAVEAMERLGEHYPELSGYYPNPKGLLFPWILSVQQLSGIYSPFTVEANYNSGMVDYNIPFTACHELSHLRGFMQEEEANFIAFLASIGSENIDFQYSGYLMGWRYCMNVLYQVDYEAWEEIRGQLSEEVEPDFSANRDFWDRYDGRIAETANKVNDTYLKANDQSEGVKSYSRMVDLIVAYRLGMRSF